MSKKISVFEILTVFIIIIIALILFYFAFKYFLELNARKKVKKNKVKGKNICPLCHTTLFAGENILSKVPKDMGKKEEYCSIHGCPHCYPQLEFGVKRECPVCHKAVPTTGHLRAIIFTREHEKKHVHIVGCTECQRRR